MNGGTVTIVRSAFIGNITISGGGLFLQAGTMTLTETTIHQNRVLNYGGGLYMISGQLTILDSAVTENRGIGGGLYMRSGQLTMMNSTVARNIGEEGFIGGLGITGGAARLVNVTVADNSAIDTVGGIAAGVNSRVELQNTIVARNHAPTQDCGGSLTSLGNNLMGDLTGCTVTLLPSDVLGEPGLADFIDDGEPGHGYIPLQPGSRAINAGNDAACLKKDQLGEKRVGICDIGAIEFQGTTVSSR